ncbi:MAG: leucine-rich repeat protein, partial [Coprobacillus sp.]
IVIPDNVETISKYSFMGCQSLSSITMSSGIKTIGEGAFMIISSNAVITMRGTTPPTIGSDAFYQPDTGKNAKILIPFGSEDNYKADSSWAELGDSITEPIPNTPTIKEVTYNQVELNELTYTDETVEYGISKTNDASTCT